MPNNPQHKGSSLPQLPSQATSSQHPQTEPLASDAAGTGDFHRRTAHVIFPDEASRISPELRRAARTANFGIIYGLDGKDWAGW